MTDEEDERIPSATRKRVWSIRRSRGRVGELYKYKKKSTISYRSRSSAQRRRILVETKPEKKI